MADDGILPNPDENYETNPELCLTNEPKADNPFRMSDIQADVNLAKSLQQELNEISSAPVTVYLLLDTEIDTLLGETKSSMYGQAITGVVGQYSPMSLHFELAKWGIDSADTDFVIIFTKDELFKKCKRILQQGDLILDNLSRLFEVTEQYDDTNFGFQFINQYVLCKRKLGDTTLLSGDYKNKSEGETNADTEAINDDQKKNFFSY